MKRCKCGAVSRVNYPFGKKGGSRTHMIIEHDKECRINKSTRR